MIENVLFVFNKMSVYFNFILTKHVIKTTVDGQISHQWIFCFQCVLHFLLYLLEVMLWYLSDHINLHRFTCGLFIHPSLIAVPESKEYHRMKLFYPYENITGKINE